jgi:hypothetical protein
MRVPPTRILAALCGLSLVALACGDASDTPDPDETTESAAAPATGDQLFDTQFGQVCRGTGQPLASEFVAGPGVHPVLFLFTDDGTEYSSRSVTLPEGWSASWPELARTELVTCIRRLSATPGQVCEGYKDDDDDTEWTVQIYDATYEYLVRNARTAEVIAKETFEVPAGRCPMFTSFSKDDPQPKPYYPSIGDGQVELFVRPHVTGN